MGGMVNGGTPAELGFFEALFIAQRWCVIGPWRGRTGEIFGPLAPYSKGFSQFVAR